MTWPGCVGWGGSPVVDSRVSKNVSYDELLQAARSREESPWWKIIGVLPRAEDEVAPSLHMGFLYTNGLSETELWCPVLSIEGRSGGSDFIANVLNTLGFAVMTGRVEPGDSVILYDDEAGDIINSIFWIGELEPNDGRRETNISTGDTVLPILWSSNAGFPDEEEFADG